MANRSPPRRPWWKLHWTTWHCGEVTLLCILYLNFGSALAIYLSGESEVILIYAGEKRELGLCGWPIPCWFVHLLPSSGPPRLFPAPAGPNEAATEDSPRADQVPAGAKQGSDPNPAYLAQFSGAGAGGYAVPPQFFLIGPLIFDIAAGLLVLAGVVITAETIRRRYPGLLQITILQCLALTAFAALFLAVVDRRDAAASHLLDEHETTPLQRVLVTLDAACEIYIVGAALICVVFLSKPRWWRARNDP